MSAAAADPAAARLGRRGQLIRLATAAAIVGLASYGSLHGPEKMFPFGPMSQYDQYVAPDGTVGSVTVWADTTAGTHVQVPLDAGGVGVKRADIELQLSSIEADPSRLQALANAQRRLHPHQPQYVRLFVIDTVTQLRNREPVGTTTSTLAHWDVPS